MRKVRKQNESNRQRGKRKSLLAFDALSSENDVDLTIVANVIGDKMQSLRAIRENLDLKRCENYSSTESELLQGSRRSVETEAATSLVHEKSARSRRESFELKHSFSGKKQALHENSKGEAEMEGGEVERVGIFGTASTPVSKCGLSGYLRSVASTREKRVAAVSAWLIALTGLIVALVFVTKDFLDSRNQLASTAHYIDEDKIRLPSLWFCTLGTEMNPFGNFPTDKYKGQPLIWIDSIYGVNSSGRMLFPDTHRAPQFDVISVNILGDPCDGPREMNPTIFSDENSRESSCFYCLSISRDPPIELAVHDDEDENEREGDEDDTRVGRVGFRLSKHSFVTSCRTNAMGISRDMIKFFRGEIKKHHVELAERSILDFGRFDPSQSASDGYLWPNYRWGYSNVTIDWAVLDVVDMFCNVYLFSGFFYPSTAKNVRYRFNDHLLLWERSGTGPYSPANFSRIQNKKGAASPLTSSSPNLGGEIYEHMSVLASDSLHILTNESQIGRAETLTTLEPNHMASIRLRRSMIRGKESFQGTVLRATLDVGDTRVLNYVYYVDISFGSSLTQVVSDQMTVSWPAFIADFFGLTSLFLDISVYTLIVSPLIVTAKKRAAVAKKMDKSFGV